MALKEEKSVRIDLPSTAEVSCEIVQDNKDFRIHFIQNDNVIKAFRVPCENISEDTFVDILSDSGIEFFSFSAIYDIATMLNEAIQKEFYAAESSKEIEKKETSLEQPVEQEEKSPLEEALSEDPKEPDTKTSTISIDPGDKLITRIELPYTKSGFASIYLTSEGKYCIIIFKKETPLMKMVYEKDKINVDDLIEPISESGVEFLSFSSIYDTAEKIYDIVMNPEKYVQEEEKPNDSIESDEINGDSLSESGEITPKIDKTKDIDIPEFKIEDYSKPEDFNRFNQDVKQYIESGNPIPVAETDIKGMKGTTCKIVRDVSDWHLQFISKDGTTSKLFKVTNDQDEITRIINQGVPQISFSYLYDAAEEIYKLVSKLMERPIEELISNIAVNHFIKVINMHEENNQIDLAIKLTEVLLKEFKDLDNAKGINQFGMRIIKYLDDQNKINESARYRKDISENLLKIDKEEAFLFIKTNLSPLIEHKRYLDAAQLCNFILEDFEANPSLEHLEDFVNTTSNQVQYYKKANLPVVVWENGLKYTKTAIVLLGNADPKDIKIDEKNNLLEKVYEIIDTAIETLDDRKAQFELIEATQDLLELFKKNNLKNSYVHYIEKSILFFESYKENDLALKYSKQASEYLLDKDNYLKACDMANKTINYLYKNNQNEKAVMFSFNIVAGLKSVEKSAAINYLNFTEQIVDKVYSDNNKKLIENRLKVLKNMTELGQIDASKNYLISTLDKMESAKERQDIIIQHCMNLFELNSVQMAQEIVNFEVTRLLNVPLVDEAVSISTNFANLLLEKENYDMAYAYTQYVGTLQTKVKQPDYEFNYNIIQTFLKLNNLEASKTLIDQLYKLQIDNKDYTRAIDYTSRIIGKLVKESEQYDLIFDLVKKVSNAFILMGDHDGSIEALIDFQKLLIGSNILIAQKITDEVLSLLEEKNRHKEAIDVTNTLVNGFLEEENFMDAYIYTVQNARYYEKVGKVDDVLDYLYKIRDIFNSKDQFDSTDRITDLMIRFATTHNKKKKAIEIATGFVQTCLESEQIETATKYAIEVATLLSKNKKDKDAIEYLIKLFDGIITKNVERGAEVFAAIVSLKKASSSIKNLEKEVLIPYMKKYKLREILDISKKALKDDKNRQRQFLENQFTDLLKDKIKIKTSDLILEFVEDFYQNNLWEDGDKLVLKFSELLLVSEETEDSLKLMELLLNRSKSNLGEKLAYSFNFIKLLINNSLIESARQFTDKSIELATSQAQSSDGKMIAAKVTEKFAISVVSENPDLALEYAYRSSDFYRSLNNIEGIFKVYTGLAEAYTQYDRKIRVLNRGIQLLRKLRAHEELSNLYLILINLQITNSDDNVLKSFKSALEEIEELGNLEKLFGFVKEVITNSIVHEFYKLANLYYEYLFKLSQMIDKQKDIANIGLYLLKKAEKENNEEIITKISDWAKNLGIKLSSYEKGYKDLIKQQKKSKEPAEVSKEKDEFIKELEEKIEDFKEIETPPATVQKDDEEYVDTIKELEGLIGDEEEIELEGDKELMITDEISHNDDKFENEMQNLIEPSSPRQDVELSDSEISNIFSSRKIVETEKEVPEITSIRDDTLEKRSDSKKMKSELTDSEIDQLFVPEGNLQEEPEVIYKEEIKGKVVELSDSDIDGLFSESKAKVNAQKEKITSIVENQEEFVYDGTGRAWPKSMMATEKEAKQSPSPIEDFLSQERVIEETSPLDLLLEDEDKEKQLLPSLDILKDAFEDSIHEEYKKKPEVEEISPLEKLTRELPEVKEDELPSLDILEDQLFEKAPVNRLQQVVEEEEDVFGSNNTKTASSDSIDPLQQLLDSEDLLGFDGKAKQKPKTKVKDDKKKSKSSSFDDDPFKEAFSELKAIKGKKGKKKKR